MSVENWIAIGIAVAGLSSAIVSEYRRSKKDKQDAGAAHTTAAAELTEAATALIAQLSSRIAVLERDLAYTRRDLATAQRQIAALSQQLIDAGVHPMEVPIEEPIVLVQPAGGS